MRQYSPTAGPRVVNVALFFGAEGRVACRLLPTSSLKATMPSAIGAVLYDLLTRAEGFESQHITTLGDSYPEYDFNSGL